MLTLFGEVETFTTLEKRESRLAERRRKAKAAYDATSAAWKKATQRFAVDEFLPDRETFLFEDLSTAYNTAALVKGLPATVNGKAFAGLQRILIAEAKIELVKGVTRIRSNGQEGKVYRSLIYENDVR